MATTIHYRKPVDEYIDVPYEKGRYRFWEKRMHLDDIFEELALPWNTDADVVEIGHAIINYCKTYRTMPTNVSWDVIDNVLYADGKPVKRVGPSHRWDGIDEIADYWEGRCLDSVQMPD